MRNRLLLVSVLLIVFLLGFLLGTWSRAALSQRDTEVWPREVLLFRELKKATWIGEAKALLGQPSQNAELVGGGQRFEWKIGRATITVESVYGAIQNSRFEYDP